MCAIIIIEYHNSFLRFPWNVLTPLGYAAIVPFIMGLFILIFYSIICVMGMMLTVFVVMLSTTNYIIFMFYVPKENFKVDKNNATFIKAFYDMARYAMKINK